MRFDVHDFDRNIEKLDRAIIQSFKETILLFGRENTRVISTPGLFEGFPGDIVDTGELRSSQTIEFDSDTEGTIAWPKAYALPVHEGATYPPRGNFKGRTQPGRPWTKKAMERFDGGKVMEKLFARYYSGA